MGTYSESEISFSFQVEFRGSESEKRLLDVLKSVRNNEALDSPLKDLGEEAASREEELTKHPKVCGVFFYYWSL